MGVLLAMNVSNWEVLLKSDHLVNHLLFKIDVLAFEVVDCPGVLQVEVVFLLIWLGKITIEAAVVDEYLKIINEERLDRQKYIVSNAILPTDPCKFTEIENRPWPNIIQKKWPSWHSLL